MHCEIIRMQHPSSAECDACYCRENCTMFRSYLVLKADIDKLKSTEKLLKAKIHGQREALRSIQGGEK